MNREGGRKRWMDGWLVGWFEVRETTAAKATEARSSGAIPWNIPRRTLSLLQMIMTMTLMMMAVMLLMAMIIMGLVV